tara:strand:- start:156 stop:392 length:237 start_codon:yes stop_codon:yes gene_type:complete
MNANTVRFANIMCEMQELLEEAHEIVSSEGTEQSQRRAYSYWYAHITGAIDKDSSDFVGGSMIDMAETYMELKSVEEE